MVAAMQETQVLSLGQEEPLANVAPGRLQSMQSQKTWTWLSDKHFSFSYLLSRTEGWELSIK